MREQYEQTRIDTRLSNRFANTALVCMFFVVLNHTWAPHTAADGLLLRSWPYINFANFILPYFFCAAGFFLAGHTEDDDWWYVALKKRLRTLVIPFTIWSMVYVLLRLVLQMDHVSDCRNWHYWIKALALNPFEHPLLAPYWFVRTLLVLVVLSPVLVWTTKKIGIWTLFLTFLLSCWLIQTPQGTWRYLVGNNLAVCWMFAFSAGILWRQGRIHCTVHAGKAWAMLLIGYGLATCRIWSGLLLTQAALPMSVWNILAERIGMPLLALGIFNVLPSGTWPRILTGSAFAIYVLHWIVLDCFSARYWYFAETTGQWLIRFAVGSIGSLFLSVLFRLFLPKVSAVLFGGRSSK